MTFVQKAIQIGQGAVNRVDRRVIADVITTIPATRRVERRDPQGVDIQGVAASAIYPTASVIGKGRADVVQPFDKPGKVADSIAVGIREAGEVDLVKDRVGPPVPGWLLDHGTRFRHCGYEADARLSGGSIATTERIGLFA
ncbi:MAG: hypothetical protein WAJ87_16990 [Bryobacteraceae bacterium]